MRSSAGSLGKGLKVSVAFSAVAIGLLGGLRRVVASQGPMVVLKFIVEVKAAVLIGVVCL